MLSLLQLHCRATPMQMFGGRAPERFRIWAGPRAQAQSVPHHINRARTFKLRNLTEPNLTKPNLTKPNLTEPNLTKPNFTYPGSSPTWPTFHLSWQKSNMAEISPILAEVQHGRNFTYPGRSPTWPTIAMLASSSPCWTPGCHVGLRFQSYWVKKNLKMWWVLNPAKAACAPETISIHPAAWR
jgi:hypothetical protein